MIDVSIIVPVYNAEQYLSTCLDSLVNQTKQEIEIIAINDGSTDNSQKILDAYAEKFPDKIRVVSQVNQKLGATRNNGIELAKGKYIAFVDSDDYIDENAMECLYNEAIRGNYDVVAMDVNCVYPDKTMVIKPGFAFKTDCIREEQKKDFLINMYPVVWNKLYKRELLERGGGIRFAPQIWFEDVLFSNMLTPYINSFSFVDIPFYQYIQRPNSITYSYTDKLNDIHYVVEKTIAFYKEKGLYERYRDELEYIYTRYMLATYLKRTAKSKDKKRYNEAVHFAMSEVKKAFPEYKKNPYLKRGLKGLYLRYLNPLLANAVFYLERNRMN